MHSINFTIKTFMQFACKVTGYIEETESNELLNENIYFLIIKTLFIANIIPDIICEERS